MTKAKKKDGRINNGGRGRNQGRKKLPKGKLKSALVLFVENDIIKSNGGEEAAKGLCFKALGVD